MGADGHVIGFRVKEHVENMIKGRIKQLEKVKEAMKNSKNPDALKIDVDFNPIYPKEDRNEIITISFSVKDTGTSPDVSSIDIGGGAPALSSSPPASVDVVAPFSDVGPIELNANSFYQIFEFIVLYLESYACFNQNLYVADEYIDDGVGFELKDFIDRYSGAWSYYDTESNPLPDNFLVNICSRMYKIDDFDEDIEEIYDNVTPLLINADQAEADRQAELARLAEKVARQAEAARQVEAARLAASISLGIGTTRQEDVVKLAEREAEEATRQAEEAARQAEEAARKAEASKNTREIFFRLFPTWETMKYYFDEELLIESEEMHVWT